MQMAQTTDVRATVAEWRERPDCEAKAIVGNDFRKNLLRLGAEYPQRQLFSATSFDTMYDDSVLECEHTMSQNLGSSSAAKEHEVLKLVRRKVLASFRARPCRNSGPSALTLHEVSIRIQVSNCRALNQLQNSFH